MTDQQQQQRINEAADEFTNALVESFRIGSERGVQAQEAGAQQTQDFFNRVINNLRSATESNEQLGQQLAEQQQRATEATQTLTQESVNAYMEWVNSAFSMAQGGIQAERRGAEEAASEAGAGGSKARAAGGGGGQG
jgi:Na+/phosphate symporter